MTKNGGHVAHPYPETPCCVLPVDDRSRIFGWVWPEIASNLASRTTPGALQT
jgi:hypothetical protein